MNLNINQNLRSIRDEVHFQGDNEWPHFSEGSLLESAVAEVITDLQVSREMALTSALGAIAVACQGLIDVEQPTGNKVTASLMLLTIAESGERKTSVEKLFFKEIRDQQKIALQDYNKAYSKYESELPLWKEKVSARFKQMNLLIKNKENTDLIEQQIRALNDTKPLQPLSKKFIYDDSTPQALVQGMNECCKNACLVSSEANSIFSGKVLADLHLINTLWDGGDVIVDRVSMQSFILNNARLTLALMTQMSVIKRFLKMRGEEARGMGFLARFLVVRPPSKAGQRDAKRNLSKLKHLENFNHRIGNLIKKSIESENNDTQNNEPENNDPENNDNQKKTITFNASAADLWRKYSQNIENEMCDDRVYEHYRDHASKLMDNISRVAGLIEHYEGKNETISTETLIFSYSLCMRYSKHFLEYLAGKPKVVIDADNLADHLLKLCDKDSQNNNMHQPVKFINQNITIRPGRRTSFTQTNIVQLGPNPLRDNTNDFATFKNAIELLRRMGFVEIDTRSATVSYKFCESLVFSVPGTLGGYERSIKVPSLKNGDEYTLESLPLFGNLIVYHPKDLETYRATGPFDTVDRFSEYTYGIKI